MHCLTQSVRGLLSVALLLGATGAQGAFQELDGVVAVVDDDVVLASELISRLETVKQQMGQANVQLPPEDILVSQLMERLVLESIQL
ncbi:MAG: molecular chaperone SurA, partial [Pseudomonadota bacterium]